MTTSRRTALKALLAAPAAGAFASVANAQAQTAMTAPQASGQRYPSPQ